MTTPAPAMPTDANANRHVHPPCGAKGRRSGLPCQRPAGWGTDHVGVGRCKYHGGSTPSGRKHGQALIAAKELARFGVPIETTPHEALLALLYGSAGRVAWLTQRIRTFAAGHGDVVDVETMAGFGTQSLPGSPESAPEGSPALLVLERPSKDAVRLTENPLLKLLRDEERHLAEIASACHRAGIEEARIDLHRTVADLLVAALARALPELGVEADADRVIEVVSWALAVTQR